MLILIIIIIDKNKKENNFKNVLRKWHLWFKLNKNVIVFLTLTIITKVKEHFFCMIS